MHECSNAVLITAKAEFREAPSCYLVLGDEYSPSHIRSNPRDSTNECAHALYRGKKIFVRS